MILKEHTSSNPDISVITATNNLMTDPIYLCMLGFTQERDHTPASTARKPLTLLEIELITKDVTRRSSHTSANSVIRAFIEII